jgi:hypothetical protein
VLGFVLEQLTAAEGQLGVPLQELETRRAVARSKEDGEHATVRLPQCRAVAKRLARDHDLARDLDEAELERQPLGVLRAWRDDMQSQVSVCGDETKRRQLGRRFGQLSAAIEIKQASGVGVGEERLGDGDEALATGPAPKRPRPIDLT